MRSEFEQQERDRIEGDREAARMIADRFREATPEDLRAARERREAWERFSLDRTPVKPTRAPAEPEPPARQTVLFSGLDCMAGQMDLFPTDGNFSE